jgi:hypothetical protein
MKCRSCGTEIAEKAIVCFRCGAPTDLPAAPARRPPAARGGPAWIAIPIVIVIIALGVWLLPQTPSGSPARWGGWILLAVTTFAVVWRLRRRR